jgi:leader peptidase (prepilin peptidase)/N-methyltransferase
MTSVWLPLALFYAFVLGLAIGSFLNVCVFRLPYEKSLVWPGSRCPSCLQAICLRDNIPVVSYLLLRGKCRSCGCRISWRYPLIELFTGLAFAGLYYLEVVVNVLQMPVFDTPFPLFPRGVPPSLGAVSVFAHHAVLLGFLIAVSLCDLEDMEIPLSLTVTGTLVGLVLATLMPWPYPEQLPWRPRPGTGVWPAPEVPVAGAYAWPVWYPLPDWLPPGSWQLGLATGLAGAAAGMVVLRGVRFLFGMGRGIEGLGVGDADLMMMAGAFIGWQPVVLAFFFAALPGLCFAVAQVVRGRGQALPFGPSLAIGVILTVMLWPRVGPPLTIVLFDPVILGLFVAVAGGGMFVLAVVFRLFHLLMHVQGGTPGPPTTGT